MSVDGTGAVGSRIDPMRRGALPAAVPILPCLHLRDFLAAPRPLPYPIGEPGTSLWYNARAAIWQGLRALGIEEGQRILAPAYSCGSEIDTLVKAGLEVDCYRVGPDLVADLSDVERLCRRPAAALMVTHFYGFAQPTAALLELSRAHGMPLIEDVSHGLGSCGPDGRPLGEDADMAVFSLWKSVPIPDGGALRLRDWKNLEDRLPPSARPGWRSRAGRLRHMAEESMLGPHPRLARFVRRTVTDPLVGWLQGGGRGAQPPIDGAGTVSAGEPPEWAQVSFRPERKDWGMTAMSRWLLPRVTAENLVQRRRQNFTALASELRPGAGVRLLFDELPDQCCPLFFPLIVDDPRPFCRYLAANGIGFFRAWCILHRHVDWSRFPLEAHLKEHGVVLPVHQGLGPGHVDRIVSVVNAWTSGHPRRSEQS